ncbi:hypothetical protein HPB51_016100 [Rhipicephalus microplus]|uniref:Carboxylesterase type B domain-containing protein n=1 Tax=Rhipicephalus microplus TaxID=6941 RepID=A0A9J6D5S6_RHIMP|nr:hypothetical protein HPB51_016100 [Rhipicephalus microplus]
MYSVCWYIGSHIWITSLPTLYPQVEWTPFPRRPIAQTNSEDDCLYLNVWQPLLEEDGGTECGVCGRPPLLPAVVVLHGGRFQYGGGGGPYTFYDGKYLAAAWRAVVVVPAYRIGAFGFLNAALQHDEAPGNVGIRDQIVALQWVHDNIHLFGASPFQVTLVGHEAGAASVSYHLMSNRSAAYFQRAVMMAGSPYSPYPENNGKAADRNAPPQRGGACHKFRWSFCATLGCSARTYGQLKPSTCSGGTITSHVDQGNSVYFNITTTTTKGSATRSMLVPSKNHSSLEMEPADSSCSITDVAGTIWSGNRTSRYQLVLIAGGLPIGPEPAKSQEEVEQSSRSR